MAALEDSLADRLLSDHPFGIQKNLKSISAIGGEGFRVEVKKTPHVVSYNS